MKMRIKIKNIIKCLAEHGTDANIKGRTPLFKVCEIGFETILEYLVNYGME